MPRVGFESTISAGERPKTYALDVRPLGPAIITTTTTVIIIIIIIIIVVSSSSIILIIVVIIITIFGKRVIERKISVVIFCTTFVLKHFSF